MVGSAEPEQTLLRVELAVLGLLRSSTPTQLQPQRPDIKSALCAFLVAGFGQGSIRMSGKFESGSRRLRLQHVRQF